MESELKENMYVRTEEGKIFKTDGDLIYLSNDKTILYKLITRIPYDTINYKVVKASYNIIDILEVGDYVNGYKVSAIYNPNGDEIVNITLIMEYGYETINTYIDDYSINSIVTKEQFEQMAYKVGE